MNIEFLKEHTINKLYKVGEKTKVFEPLAKKLIEEKIAKQVFKTKKIKEGE